MSQDFKFKFDKLKENNPSRNEETVISSSDGNEYAGYSNVRILCFLWPDNKRHFLNYSYLVSGEYLPSLSIILLGFTSHMVSIKGNNLESLFEQIMSQTVRQIICADQRYMSLGEEITIVYEISIEKQI